MLVCWLCACVEPGFVLYPMNLVKTRLQVQQGSNIYRGTVHALFKIARLEGYQALWRGFPVNSLAVIVSQAYARLDARSHQSV